MLPIYVDIDDVLADTAGALIDLAESAFGKTVAFNDLKSFDLKVSFDLTQEEYEYFLNLAHEPDKILGLSPYTEAIGAVQAIEEAGLVPGEDIKVIGVDATAHGFLARISR